LVNLKNKKFVIGTVLTSALLGCGGFVYTTVGGTVSGLIVDGLGNLVLKNEGNFTTSVVKDGPFSFREASNASYVISVLNQPNPVFCTVANGTGQMTSDAPVNNIVVTCVPNVPVGGTINGLVRGTTIALSNNGVQDFSRTDPVQLPPPAEVLPAVDPSFTLAHYVVNKKTYNVAVSSQPAAQVCSVVNGTGVGTVDNTNLPAAKNVVVNCVPGIPVNVNLATELKSGGRLILSNNDNDALTLAAIGDATFNKSLLNGNGYNIKVSNQPYSQFCSVTGATGTAVTGTIIKAGISCVDAMSVTGTLSGLKTGSSVTLSNNGGDPLTLTANTVFLFANSLLANQPYAITVTTQPTGQTCTVTNGVGTAAITTPVTDPKITVACK
jgi:hypothetical protein